MISVTLLFYILVMWFEIAYSHRQFYRTCTKSTGNLLPG